MFTSFCKHWIFCISVQDECDVSSQYDGVQSVVCFSFKIKNSARYLSAMSNLLVKIMSMNKLYIDAIIPVLYKFIICVDLYLSVYMIIDH